MARAIAQGDLSHDVELASKSDFFGQALQTMTESLQNLIVKIKATAEELAGQAVDLQQLLGQFTLPTDSQAKALPEPKAAQFHLPAMPIS